MNGSEELKFKILGTLKFEKTYEKLKNKECKDNKDELEKLMLSTINDLGVNARQKTKNRELERWPSKTAKPGYEFWKQRLKLPGQSGSAELGRLMYLVDTKQRKLHLLWIYTHAEFEKRPKDEDLKQVINDIISEEVSDRDNNSASSSGRPGVSRSGNKRPRNKRKKR